MSNLISAGLLMCRWKEKELEYFLVHPGGPFNKNKDKGVWSIPKGLPEKNEELLNTGIREFEEETGLRSTGPYYHLGSIRQKAGKIVHCWAFLGEWDETNGIRSNLFRLEWPPRSGKFQEFPEQDRGAWFTLENARTAIIPEQVPLLIKGMEVLSDLPIQK